MQFDLGKISQTTQAITGLLEKLLMIAVIIVGANLVFRAPRSFDAFGL